MKTMPVLSPIGMQCKIQFSSVQSLSHVQFFVTPMDFSNQASQFITNSRNLHKLMSIALVMPSNQLILCHSLLLPPSIFPSLRVFAIELVLCIRWPKYWSFSFSVSPSNEYSGLISFRMDWLDLLAVQGTLKSLLQHQSINSLALSFGTQTSLVAQMVKCLTTMWGRPGFDPWVGKIPWRRKWQSTPVLLPGKSHEQRSLVGYSPWGRKELDTTERLHFTSAFFIVQLSHPYITTGKTIALT